MSYIKLKYISVQLDGNFVKDHPINTIPEGEQENTTRKATKLPTSFPKDHIFQPSMHHRYFNPDTRSLDDGCNLEAMDGLVSFTNLRPCSSLPDVLSKSFDHSFSALRINMNQNRHSFDESNAPQVEHSFNESNAPRVNHSFDESNAPQEKHVSGIDNRKQVFKTTVTIENKPGSLQKDPNVSQNEHIYQKVDNPNELNQSKWTCDDSNQSIETIKTINCDTCSTLESKSKESYKVDCDNNFHDNLTHVNVVDSTMQTCSKGVDSEIAMSEDHSVRQAETCKSVVKSSPNEAISAVTVPNDNGGTMTSVNDMTSKDNDADSLTDELLHGSDSLTLTGSRSPMSSIESSDDSADNNFNFPPMVAVSMESVKMPITVLSSPTTIEEHTQSASNNGLGTKRNFTNDLSLFTNQDISSVNDEQPRSFTPSTPISCVTSSESSASISYMLPVSSSLFDLVTMVQRLIGFGATLCQTFCRDGQITPNFDSSGNLSSPVSSDSSEYNQPRIVGNSQQTLYDHFFEVIV